MPEVIVDGLSFPECPRWRDGSLWLSEKRGRRVLRVSTSGEVTCVVELRDEPGGIGWLPDGRLLIVSQTERKLVSYGPDGLSEFADLRRLTGGKCNDMVVDGHGRAYVGHFGFDVRTEPPRPASLVLVTPAGEARVVAEDLFLPNGAEITPDGRTFVLAETGTRRLLSFEIAEDGSLSGRRIVAELDPVGPDGICLDAEGAIWVADPRAGEIVRVVDGGEITQRISAGGLAPFACTLGGPEGRSLFICADEIGAPMQEQPTRAGQISVVDVGVPAPGSLES